MGLGARYVVGFDEVGRGALAGPVSVGAVVVDASSQRPLPGVRDSKLLSAVEREALVPLIREWAVGSAVGHASAAEIDALGLSTALRVAALRAWNQLLEVGVRAEAAIVDGKHDWVSTRQLSMFELAGHAEDGYPTQLKQGIDVPVYPRIKADLECLSVAAASVLAKVERDAQLVDLDGRFPNFGWKVNKGYATSAHRAAIAIFGPSPWHRLSWRLSGAAAPRPEKVLEAQRSSTDGA